MMNLYKKVKIFHKTEDKDSSEGETDKEEYQYTKRRKLMVISKNNKIFIYEELINVPYKLILRSHFFTKEKYFKFVLIQTNSSK